MIDNLLSRHSGVGRYPVLVRHTGVSQYPVLVRHTGVSQYPVLVRHTGVSRYPVINNILRSRPNLNFVHLTQGMNNHLDTGLRRYDNVIANAQFSLNAQSWSLRHDN